MTARYLRCYGCNFSVKAGLDACPHCGSVAFSHGPRPSRSLLKLNLFAKRPSAKVTSP